MTLTQRILTGSTDAMSAVIGIILLLFALMEVLMV